jgi:dolichyl-phosphate beta-glucosyltransferase
VPTLGIKPGRSPVFAWCSAVAIHLLVTIAVTYPAVLFAHSDLFGAIRGDKYQFIWNFWLLKHSLLVLHQFPFYTEFQYYPTGVSLALHDTTYFWSLLSVPMQLFLDPRIVFNLFLLVCLPANGVAFYWLAKEVTREHWGALAGSVVFAYCPYFIGRFQVSHIQYLGVFFIPLFLLSLWRYRRDPRSAHLLKAGLLLALQGLITFYYAVAMSAILLLFLSYHVARSRGQWRSAAFWRTLSLHASALALITAAILSPVVIPILAQIQRGDFRRTTTPSSYEYLEISSGDLASYFVPDFTTASWRGWSLSMAGADRRQRLKTSLYGNPFEKAVYPGWISWIALVGVLASTALRRRYWPWAVLALGGFVLTLGPTLYVKGEPYLQGMLPLRFLYHVPILNIIRAPTRFAFFIPLGAGVALAGLIAWLRDRRGTGITVGTTIGCILATCVEFAPNPTPHFPKDLWLSPFYAAIRADADDYSILNIPVDFEEARAGGDIYQYAQVIHQKPIIGGYVSREPDYVFEPLDGSAFLQSVLDRRHEADPRLRISAAGFADMHRTLREFEVRYVVVHRRFVARSEWEDVNSWLESGLGPSIYEDRWIRVYAFYGD